MEKRVAFCGTRGVPANYGGFETAVDEISRRFVTAGVSCDVFCRLSSITEARDWHEGRRLIFVPGSKHSVLDTVISSIQTGWYLFRNRKQYSHVFWFNNANLPGILLTRLSGLRISINTDGLEWRRKKWPIPMKAYYVLCSLFISLLCRDLISDSRAIQAFYRRRFMRKTHFIPYGYPPIMAVATERQREILGQLGLEPGRYLLQITRLEPDNLPLEVAQGFLASTAPSQGLRMVTVGFKHETQYALKLKSIADGERLLVLPAIYDPEVLYTLRRNCFGYVHGNSVGGTNPALLEAMALCPRILAIDGPFSQEVLGELGNFFDPSRLNQALSNISQLPDQREQLAQRVFGSYQWDAVAAAYIQLAEGRTPLYSPQAVDLSVGPSGLPHGSRMGE